eukprot:Unigene4225_Nuclearia_a/m.12859 Unigene4225_Nuclearia_a/g.12859  ORF Unigene4225_Nuclearia_a/g.12859 Unigene4225_Nuclearia_a/m.12859 type:complete len:251 (-) Unigene4225_Nuclearia_a:79-831(-)
MTSIGTGYDLSCTTFSPDGRVFQVEYAAKAVDNSGTCVGVRCKDGVVLGVEKLVASKLLVKHSNRRIQTVDTHFGVATAGLVADGRALVNRAQDEAQRYRDFLRTVIPTKVLVEQVAMYVQAYTLYSGLRPFGAAVLLAGMDRDGPQLFMIEPSGVYYGYHGCAVGKGKQQARTEIEKTQFGELTCRQAIKEVARIIHAVHDETKDKAFELELSWVCEESKGKHQMVPRELATEAEAEAMRALEAAEMAE